MHPEPRYHVMLEELRGYREGALAPTVLSSQCCARAVDLATAREARQRENADLRAFGWRLASADASASVWRRHARTVRVTIVPARD